MYLFQYFAGLEITFGKNTVYTSLIHKMRTFIENYLHFMKNCIRPHYEKLKSLKSGFIENSIFENNRDPWLKAENKDSSKYVKLDKCTEKS